MTLLVAWFIALLSSHAKLQLIVWTRCVIKEKCWDWCEDLKYKKIYSCFQLYLSVDWPASFPWALSLLLQVDQMNGSIFRDSCGIYFVGSSASGMNCNTSLVRYRKWSCDILTGSFYRLKSKVVSVLNQLSTMP